VTLMKPEPAAIPKPPRHERRALTEEEWRALLTAARSSCLRDWALLQLIYEAALRASEVGKLTLEHAAYLSNKHSIYISRAKGSHGGYVQLIPATRTLLLRWIRETYPDQAKRRPANPLFLAGRYKGEPRGLSRWGVARVVAELGASAGIPPEIAHPHAIRHGRIMHIVQRAAEDPNFSLELLIPAIAKLVGHASARTTVLHYLSTTRGAEAVIAATTADMLGDDDD
jgi:integrase